jgi:hypothetical protein
LLPPPAVGDNAAMQTKPPKAEPPKRTRRWFQFSLRTLMIVVTLLAVPMGYVGWQAKIVKSRSDLLEQIKKRNRIYLSFAKAREDHSRPNKEPL